MEMGELGRKMRIGDGDGGMCMEKGIGEMRMIGKCCWGWEMEMEEYGGKRMSCSNEDSRMRLMA